MVNWKWLGGRTISEQLAAVASLAFILSYLVMALLLMAHAFYDKSILDSIESYLVVFALLQMPAYESLKTLMEHWREEHVVELEARRRKVETDDDIRRAKNGLPEVDSDWTKKT